MNSKDSSNSVTRLSLAIIGLCALIPAIITIASIRDLPNAIGHTFKRLVEEQVISTNPIPHNTGTDAIYVLGGSPASLRHRYAKAADLYHNGVSHRILILSRPGITQFSHRLGRNLTNDEWSVLKLEELGVPQNAVQPITIKEGFFGTYREAKAISLLIKERGYKRTILISSPSHTRRVRISFQKFLTNENTQFLVQASNDRTSTLALISEFMKLKLYQSLLLS
jgi:uncharacterized SAM-binding protein YcdF (DUF218 family)